MVNQQISESIVRSGDIRGEYPVAVNEDVAWLLGVCIGEWAKRPMRIGIARDTRPSGIALSNALIEGLSDKRLSLVDLGVVPKEVAAFAVLSKRIDLAVVVTASHHPLRMNGFKVLTDPADEQDVVSILSSQKRFFGPGRLSVQTAQHLDGISSMDLCADYVEWVLTEVDPPSDPGPILVSALGGTAASVIDPLASKLGWSITTNQWRPDDLPSWGPDPALQLNASAIEGAIVDSGASLGVAWDGDCDRCVFFDSNGRQIATPYINQLIVSQVAKDESGARCISDGRSLFNIEAELRRLGGTLEIVEAGSFWVRQAMVRHQGTYGMESSAHHYFGSLKGFDSGLLSFLHLVSAIEQSGGSIEQAREMCLEDGQCLAEATIENLSIDQATHQLDARFGRYRVSQASQHTQVVFGERDQWRVTLQPSKTERALRMNVEAKKSDGSLEALGYDFLQSMQATTREPLAAL